MVDTIKWKIWLSEWVTECVRECVREWLIDKIVVAYLTYVGWTINNYASYKVLSV